MKKSLYIFFALCLLSAYTVAQNSGRTIVDELNSSKWGQGNIKVMQDEAVQGLIAVHHINVVDTTKSLGSIDPNTSYTKAKGFKIQVYSGNNQAKSRNEAFSRRSQVENAYPQLESEVTFKSPFWRLRVGNFLNREDAEEVLKEMKKTFPRLGREMYVVPDVVKRPVQ